jgi:hypothetical protein
VLFGGKTECFFELRAKLRCVRTIAQETFSPRRISR